MFEIFLYSNLFKTLLVILGYICFHKQINFLVVSLTGKWRIQRGLYKKCKLHDFPIINDIYVPVGDNKYKKVDTIIFGNKYIYIITEIKEIGRIITSSNDEKWRSIYQKRLHNINNPLIHNRKIMNCLVNVVENLEERDLKSMVIITDTCKFDPIEENNKEYVVSEKKAIKTILEIEKESPDDIIDPNEINRYCKAFYDYGLKAEREIKGRR